MTERPVLIAPILNSQAELIYVHTEINEVQTVNFKTLIFAAKHVIKIYAQFTSDVQNDIHSNAC